MDMALAGKIGDHREHRAGLRRQRASGGRARRRSRARTWACFASPAIASSSAWKRSNPRLEVTPNDESAHSGRLHRQHLSGRRRLRRRGRAAAGGRPLPEGVGVKDFGIRGFDLAYALLEPYDLVDPGGRLPRAEAPGTLYLIEPDRGEVRQRAAAGACRCRTPWIRSSVLALVRSMGGAPGRC